MSFADFFQAATGNLPYDYQSRLAGSDSGTGCCSQLINKSTAWAKVLPAYEPEYGTTC